jgi:phage host-nuclease inhibitor protein Gam
MTKSRIKIAANAIHTREEMEALVGEITALKTREQKLTAEMNQRINEIRMDYDATLGGIAADIEGKSAVARAWAEAPVTRVQKTEAA